MQVYMTMIVILLEYDTSSICDLSSQISASQEQKAGLELELVVDKSVL